MELDTGMTQDDRAVVSGALSKLLADLFTLYLKTQNFHWNIHGPQFFALHKMSQEHYEEMANEIDEVAERIRALGYFVDGTMENFLKLTSVQEDHEVHPAHTYIERLVAGHEVLIKEARVIAKLAEDHHDHATVDMMGRMLNVHEKSTWMLRDSI